MVDLNLQYGYASDEHVQGQVADARYTDIVTRTVSTNLPATTYLQPGFPVCRDADDLMVKYPTAAGDVVTGIIRWSAMGLETLNDGTRGYRPAKVLPVLSRGPIWVETSTAVTQGQFAYALINGSGQFTSTAGAGTTTRPVGVFETSTTGAGSAIIYVTPGLVAPAA